MLFALYYLGLEHSKDPNCGPYPQHTALYLGKPKQTNKHFYAYYIYFFLYLLRLPREIFAPNYLDYQKVQFFENISRKLKCQFLKFHREKIGLPNFSFSILTKNLKRIIGRKKTKL